MKPALSVIIVIFAVLLTACAPAGRYNPNYRREVVRARTPAQLYSRVIQEHVTLGVLSGLSFLAAPRYSSADGSSTNGRLGACCVGQGGIRDLGCNGRGKVICGDGTESRICSC